MGFIFVWECISFRNFRTTLCKANIFPNKYIWEWKDFYITLSLIYASSTETGALVESTGFTLILARRAAIEKYTLFNPMRIY